MNPEVSVIMGSQSDWAYLQETAKTLQELDISYEAKIVSAHRTPDLLFTFAEEAASRDIKVIIAGAGGAAHLPGMVASKTTLPVIGVPIPSKHLQGLDSLLSIVQMPKGIPVGTVAIGEAGAINAALYAAQIIGSFKPTVREKIGAWRQAQTEAVLSMKLSPLPMQK